MLDRRARLCCLLILTLSFLLPATVNATISKSTYNQLALGDFPTVDPDYIYDQLFVIAAVCIFAGSASAAPVRGFKNITRFAAPTTSC